MDRKTLADEAVIFHQLSGRCTLESLRLRYSPPHRRQQDGQVETATSRECQAVVFLVMNVDEIANRSNYPDSEIDSE